MFIHPTRQGPPGGQDRTDLFQVHFCTIQMAFPKSQPNLTGLSLVLFGTRRGTEESKPDRDAHYRHGKEN